jgi:hypothetical protein
VRVAEIFMMITLERSDIILSLLMLERTIIKRHNKKQID